MLQLPYYPLKDIIEKSTIDVRLQLFKAQKTVHKATSEVIFRKFDYPEDTTILKKYGKYIQIINEIKDWQNEEWT